MARGMFSGKSKPHKPLKDEQNLDLDAAKTIAQLVSVSYCHDVTAVANWSCSRCEQQPKFVLSEVVENTTWNVFGFAGYYPPWKAKMLIFRGTHGRDFKNWVENFRAQQHHVRFELTHPEFEDVRVHNGFRRIWNIPFKNSVLTAVQHLTDIYGADGPLYIAGHSAGGATAQLAAATLALVKEYDDIHLYTFGSPRVGNLAFAAMLSTLVSESWRFTHNRDIVPTLPWMTMGFWHSAQEVFQQENAVRHSHHITNYRVCDGTGEDPKGHNSMCRFGFGCDSVNDHYFYLNTIMENDGTC